ncbi:hypothetical protein [Actinophytocola gossypii]|uniref:Uncharacterized protein n=1 Tax=Actinophytocola gossypii TaxID=2812003 RepID=A0ABT2J3E5_9PSEU|nr:hypothetical protein [Actinophytocola gossypii]MCT2582375.1 hypothetical protein [Actinophytocola gossypii]
MTDDHVLGRAGEAISGGGYFFASLEELDHVIKEWTMIRDDIEFDRQVLVQAQSLIEPPAKDIMSDLQPAAMNHSLDKAITHNANMSAYARAYIEKLTATKKQYSSDDESGAVRMREIDVE